MGRSAINLTCIKFKRVGQLGVTVGLSVERTERPETHCGPRRGEFAPGAPGRRPGVWVAKSCYKERGADETST